MKKENEDILLPVELSEKFKELAQEYMRPFFPPENYFLENEQQDKVSEKSSEEEIKKIKQFIGKGCQCDNHCHEQFSIDEMRESRNNFKSMTWHEQHCFIVGQLQTFLRNSAYAKSARKTKLRIRKKFDYFINADRPVCRNMYLFYYGETLDRLKNRTKYLDEFGTLSPTHGNKGKSPSNACTKKDKDNFITFITNYAVANGIPDPGRDLRSQQSQLKIYLPAIMTYKTTHQVYVKSLNIMKKKTVKYHAFRKLWLKLTPHIVFIKPRTDICRICEDHKKSINSIVAKNEEDKDDELIKCFEQARNHLVEAKVERDFYRDSIKTSKESYDSYISKKSKTQQTTENDDFTMHYSWDFAQQVNYPYEDSASRSDIL